MVAYWVARSKVNNPDQYKKYADLVPGILQKFGGKFLARGGKFKILEGPEKFHRFIVIEFPSFEKAVACHESPEYLEAAAHRKKDGAGELEIVIVETAGRLAIRRQTGNPRRHTASPLLMSFWTRPSIMKVGGVGRCRSDGRISVWRLPPPGPAWGGRRPRQASGPSILRRAQ